ncbi:hypothetical protein [Myroides marinus]|uniref:hypothetical protein n=1 Tax=Myroides marinus TaxID=703342 RepID=UPI002575A930|nr:hypothetical protein [Myroides marinus]MDM1368916.1 hypothetical protein [Myroides marinus]MDM1375602.1 hypothetical protein [Myroides marinus]MDM1378942.1 hypothetical protein [Myroides marinus]MDM1382828.1 hypothetical protein [Myroides marinus]MDM1386213.1 hypothetical protein [Myroides marinus]
MANRELINITKFLQEKGFEFLEGLVTLLSFAENKRLVTETFFNEEGKLLTDRVLYEEMLTEEGELVFLELANDWFAYIKEDHNRTGDSKYLTQLYKNKKTIVDKVQKYTQWSWALGVSNHWAIGINNPKGNGYLEDSLLFTAENTIEGKALYVMYRNEEVGYEVEYMEYNRTLGGWDYEGEFRKYAIICQSHNSSEVENTVQSILNPGDENLLKFIQYGYWYVVANKLMTGYSNYENGELLYFASTDKLFLEVVYERQLFKITLGRVKHSITKGTAIIHSNNIEKSITYYVETERELVRKLETLSCLPNEFV